MAELMLKQYGKNMDYVKKGAWSLKTKIDRLYHEISYLELEPDALQICRAIKNWKELQTQVGQLSEA
ncbi:hypothetical protein HAX54_048470 [Datura stramonium]|uniref:Uncharacterized protein n=1 Tax=Datura stramonium TaxID=4076 RepID=A0ABS8RQV0_DATST|nr:hypothetical protein [Datura stramonium]